MIGTHEVGRADQGSRSRRWRSATAPRFASLFVVACVCLALQPLPAFARLSPPPVTVLVATVMTMQGAPVWSRNIGSHRRVASCIKMLTALVVREHAGLDDVVVVPRQAEAINDGDVGLVKGQRLTVRQLLQIMLIPSANDAAMALAIHVGGTEAAFVDMMNAKAKALGLKHTRAADPDGLNKKEICTAEDLTVLGRDVMADPVLRQIVGMRSVVVPHPKKKSTVHASTDLLLGHYTGMEGTKTGFTNPAGYCFVGSAKRGGVELLGVVLGATSNAGRFSEMRKLLDWGFAHTHVRVLISSGATLGVVPVVNGVETTVAVCTTHSVSAAVYDSGGAVTTSLTLPASVLATVSAGQTLGVVAAYKDGAMIATAAVVAARDVPATSVPPTSAVPAQVGVSTLRAPWEAEAAGTLGVWIGWTLR